MTFTPSTIATRVIGIQTESAVFPPMTAGDSTHEVPLFKFTDNVVIRHVELMLTAATSAGGNTRAWRFRKLSNGSFSYLTATTPLGAQAAADRISASLSDTVFKAGDILTMLSYQIASGQNVAALLVTVQYESAQ